LTSLKLKLKEVGEKEKGEGEEAGNGDKEEDEESSNLVPRMRRIQRAYLIIRKRGKNGVGDR
jgi:hypothetical protein